MATNSHCEPGWLMIDRSHVGALTLPWIRVKKLFEPLSFPWCQDDTGQELQSVPLRSS